MISMCFRSNSGEPAIEYRSSLRSDLQINPSAADVWYAYQGENHRYWGYVVGSTQMDLCIVRTVSVTVFNEKRW